MCSAPHLRLDGYLSRLYQRYERSPSHSGSHYRSTLSTRPSRFSRVCLRATHPRCNATSWRAALPNLKLRLGRSSDWAATMGFPRRSTPSSMTVCCRERRSPVNGSSRHRQVRVGETGQPEKSLVLYSPKAIVLALFVSEDLHQLPYEERAHQVSA